MESRHLGPITLDGGVGGGWMDSVVHVAGSPVPFRLEIDYPGNFNEGVVTLIDIALDNLAQLDEYSRQTIAAALPQADSAPARLFEAWDQPGDASDFLHQLRPTNITLLPDGGRGSADRVVVVYRLPESSEKEKITVRFRDRIGPELDPAPRGDIY